LPLDAAVWSVSGKYLKSLALTGGVLLCPLRIYYLLLLEGPL
jgi:hypothetical protein